MNKRQSYVDSEFQDPQFGSFQLREWIFRYLRRWPLFVLSLMLSFISAFLFLYYNVAHYEAYATVLVKDERKSSGINESAFFEDLGILIGRGNLDNEIELLKSRSLMREVVAKLNLHISLFEEKQPIDKDLYPEFPIQLNFIAKNEEPQWKDTSFSMRILSDKQFQLKNEAKETLTFGTTLLTSFGTLRPEAIFGRTKDFIGKEIRIQFKPIEQVTNHFLNQLKIEPVNNKANVIRLSLRDPVRIKAIDILNTLIEEHRQNEINENNQVALNTAAFIKERILYLNEELTEVESTVQDYKTGNELINLPIESDLFLTKANEAEKQLSETFIQLELSRYLLDFLETKSAIQQLIPSNLGLTQQTISLQIETYNKLAMEASRMNISSGKANPKLVQINQQLASIKSTIQQALRNEIKALEMRFDERDKQLKQLQGKIAAVPRKEREFRELERQRQIKESLYLYLLQKREETSIALAVPLFNSNIIDSAYSNGQIVAPNKKLIFALALMAGIFLPMLLLYLMRLFNTNVRELHELQALDIPLAGEIPFARVGDAVLFKSREDRAALESFRNLRTNLSFLLDPPSKKAQVIAITSSVAKEGKTFISLNLAAAMAYSGKRVLVAGFDLRTPKLLSYLQMPESKGITNLLTGQEKDIQALIKPVEGIDGLFVLPSGDIPPNPSELLMKESIKDIFEYLQNRYDYIILDTAPAGLVADALLLESFTDVFLYIIRSGFTDKRLLHLPLEMYKEKRLRNMALIFNEANIRTEYGYTYGYYGKRPKKPFFRRITDGMRA